MEIIYGVIFFTFGLFLGSFFNVVGMRLPKGESIIKPSSHCTTCNHKLSFWELIPVVSFIIQKGRCRHCNAKLSIFYPFVELFTGLLFLIAYYSFGFSGELALALGIISLFMIVLVSDLNYFIISDEVIIFFSLYFIIIQFIRLGFLGGANQILNGVLMVIIMFSLMKLGNALFKKESLGGGDVKLMFLLGLVLDPILGIFSIFLSSLLALPISFVVLLTKKENIIPFGPFILLSFLLLFFMKITGLDFLSFLGM